MTEPNPPLPPGPEQKPPAAQDLWAQSAPVSGAKEDPHAPGWERGVLEKLAFSALAEQRSVRRWRTFTRLLWLVFFVFLVWALLGRDMAATTKSGPHTAVVDIKGEIASGAEASAEFVVAALRSAFEDEGSKAVVLLINSPGGSPVQAGIINDEIVRLKAKHHKPLYAVVEVVVLGAARDMASHTRKTKKASQDRRTKVFQRRAARCSRKDAKASFSSVARSQPGAEVGSFFDMAEWAGEDAGGRSKGSKP